MAVEIDGKHETDVTFFNGAIAHSTAAAYGVASIGTVIFIITPQILLLYFLTQILAVPPAWAGLALLAPKAIEIFLDPAVGALSDRTASSLGRRWPYLAVGALTFPLVFAGLFAPPNFAQWPLTLAWVTAV